MHCTKLVGQRLMARDFRRIVAKIQVCIARMKCYNALGIPVPKAMM